MVTRIRLYDVKRIMVSGEQPKNIKLVFLQRIYPIYNLTLPPSTQLPSSTAYCELGHCNISLAYVLAMASEEDLGMQSQRDREVPVI